LTLVDVSVWFYQESVVSWFLSPIVSFWSSSYSVISSLQMQ